MKITKSQLKRIITEAVMTNMGSSVMKSRATPEFTAFIKEGMLNIISNKYSPETEVYNRIANYALRNDMQGALGDKMVNTPDLDLDIDGMGEWVSRVGARERGEEDWMSPGTVTPDNWDPDLVYDFMEDLLNAWNNQIDQEDLQTHQSSPNVKEREALGAAFTISYFLPDNISSIVYQPRMKGGKIFRIDLETEYDTTWIDDAFVKGRGTTISDIVKVLARGGAKLRKRKPSAKHIPPMYD